MFDPAPFAHDQKTDWMQLPAAKRELAMKRERFIKPVIEKINLGSSARVAIDNLLTRLAANQAGEDMQRLATELGRKHKPPSMATLQRWIADYQAQGIIGLASGHKGRQRKTYGWEARALYWYQKPTHLAMAAIADLLVQEAFEEVTESRVTRYLNSLPHDVLNQRRMGAKTYRDAHKPFVRRDTDCIPPGAIYQGDGHTIDAYLAHPITGNPWRPELTVWIDVGSRRIVGWYMSVAESSVSTLFSLSHALISHDHVPAALHIDNGSGFKSKMMNDESIGFYARFDIQTMFSIPGNPKAKGQVERWFRTLRDRFDKTFDSYCGHDMSGDALRELLADVKKGKKQLPTLDVYLDGLNRFIEHYNNKPHSSLNGDTPEQRWQKLERTPVHMIDQAIVRPRIQRKVSRGTIRLFNREYRHAELIRYNQDVLNIEYDLHNDSMVRVMTMDERFICDAALTQRMPYVSASRLEDMQQQRLAGQVKRLERHVEEKRERARMGINHEDYIKALGVDTDGAIEHQAMGSLEELDDAKVEQDIPINIFDTDY
jgi:putative transposase